MKKVLDTYKANDWVNSYIKGMTANLKGKFIFFDTQLNGILEETSFKCMNILEVWCASWFLLEKIKEKYWTKVNTIWIDANDNLIKIAKQNWLWNYLVDDAYILSEIGDSSIDIILYSSVLHELWSYYKWNIKYERSKYIQWILDWLISASRVLKKWWYILIKDPVLPINDEKKIVLEEKKWIERYFVQDGKKIDIKWLSIDELKKLFNLIKKPWDLDLISRSIFFLSWFMWAPTEVRKLSKNIFYGDKIVLNIWIVSEMARHTKIWDTLSHFADEQKEWYGSLNINEWSKICSYCNLNLISHEAVFTQNNHSKWLWEHYDLYDDWWKQLDQKEILPTHQFTILRK